MDFIKQSEFIRLVDNEPLTLACSPLADFLWGDFVRDARPTVHYLVDHYNIRQLSRFGKELFERLYNADQVTWLVTEDAYEEYYRKVCDGDTTVIPEGYKPENGIWWAIMSDLTQAAAWPELLRRSVGEQFNAGNNAINIVNSISDIIEEAIEQNQFDVQLLTNGGKQLQRLREQYQKAVAEGDKESAQKARAEGKALNQAINEAIQKARETIQPQTHEVVDDAVKNSDDTNESISNLFGSEAGHGHSAGNLKEKRELAKKLKTNKNLKVIIKKLGALRRVWYERKRAKKTTSNYEAITGARFSDDLTRAFPTEIALANTPQGRALFALKYSQKTLLTKDYTANVKNQGKGPIVLYVDVSGSMSGDAEIWSKAIAFVIAEEALKEKREVRIHLFDTRVQDSVILSGDRKNNKELIEFIGDWTLGGGTSFNSVIAHAVDKGVVGERADVLLITDGNSEVNENFKRRLNQFKNETGTQWSTICINMAVPQVCKDFSDEVYSVDLCNNETTVDSIQKCLR